MKIAIVGHGFVGKATDAGFRCDKVIIDPALYKNDVEDLYSQDIDAAFVCVPTPMNKDGSIHSSIAEEVITKLASHPSNPVIILKSTIHPGVLKKLDGISDKLVYNPEFLTERNAIEDFINSKMIVIGSNRVENTVFVEDLYRDFSIIKECPVYKTDIASASMIKYTINCFLALKVGFFNQIHDVFHDAGCEIPWEFFTSILTTDPRVGNSHMSIPGPDGRKGWGGACFTKDTNALVAYNDSLTILNEAIKANKKVRSQYDDLDAREKEQGAHYD